ncbi:hypothetical protein An04g03540 [Aspergillus niger]|uniref:Uncharacterized protein n=2 Tax=Aspergillus niger TaxID=5061 RepID=A2QIH5_ASPNC|nr:hypothetical protein An04g03540 [Aspergillus niger]CAK38619.1 hypothetical protein An04g03540 [Aspergillus niger]
MSPWVASSGGMMLAQDGHEGSCEQLEIGTSTQERLAARERVTTVIVTALFNQYDISTRSISSFSPAVTGPIMRNSPRSVALTASSKANLRPDRHEQRTTAGHGFPLEGPLFVECSAFSFRQSGDGANGGAAGGKKLPSTSNRKTGDGKRMTVRVTVGLSLPLLLITGPAWAVLEATFYSVEHSTGWSRVVRRSSRIQCQSSRALVLHIIRHLSGYSM